MSTISRLGVFMIAVGSLLSACSSNETPANEQPMDMSIANITGVVSSSQVGAPCDPNDIPLLRTTDRESVTLLFQKACVDDDYVMMTIYASCLKFINEHDTHPGIIPDGPQQ